MKLQRLLEVIGALVVLLSAVLVMGSWKGTVDIEIKNLKATDVQHTQAIEEESAQRRAEYLRLNLKMTEISSGQDWIIMKLKGELD